MTEPTIVCCLELDHGCIYEILGNDHALTIHQIHDRFQAFTPVARPPECDVPLKT
jgi:hypothetical protein